MVASTLGDMKERIADELLRSDIPAQIGRAISTAIKHYERRRFFFNEGIGTFSTVASQEYYGAADLAGLATLVDIVSLRMTVSGSRRILTKRSFEEIDAVASSTTTGDPCDYCYFAQSLRLYPMPGSVQTATIAYIKRLDALASDTESNAWTDDAEELIRTHAKSDLIVNVIRDGNSADVAALQVQEAGVLARLLSESASRGTTGFVRATAF